MSMGISKAQVSEKGLKASGSIGGQKGNVGISRDGVVELGINVGIAQIGFSTDYGGGVVVGFAGQKIVWGLEGGKISIRFGGFFEVDVEARDCVVSEIKRIAGIVVSSRTYPDPGCKLPPEPDRVKKEPFTPPTIINPVGLPMAKDCASGKFLCIDYLPIGPQRQRYFLCEDSLARYCYELNSHPTDTNDELMARWYFGGAEWETFRLNRESISPCGIWYYSRNLNPFVPGMEGGSLPNMQGTFRLTYSILLYVPKGASKESPGNRWFTSGGFNYKATILSMKPPPSCGLDEPKLSPPSPSAGNRPPMKQDCCEILKADLEDIKEVLATKEMLAKKLTFPWRLRMPGGEGDEIITDYPNLARAVVQVIDHLGIHPPKLSIKDINNAIAGDQSISNQFPCATQGFEALMAQVWDANADVDTLTNFLYRLSWLCVQQSMNLAVVSSDIQSIKDMVGGKTVPDVASITTPFNIGAGIKKASTRGEGFGKKGGAIDKKIDANTELATESLLPDFLQIRDNDIAIERFDGGKDVFDMLSMILLKIEKLEAR